MVSLRKPTHPGEVLREDVINALGITVTEAATHLKVAQDVLVALLNCKIPVTPDMAVRIGQATRTTPESWLSMQAKLDLWTALQSPPQVEVFRQLHPA